MRRLLAVLLLAWAAPVLAEDWQRYDNALFGYALDLPASFIVEQQDDARLALRSGAVTLEVFGLDLAPLGFEEAVALAMRSGTDEGFAIAAQAVTPGWARWTGINGAWQLAAGLVPLCGAAVAGYEMRYMEADGAAMQSVVERLATSLQRTRAC